MAHGVRENFRAGRQGSIRDAARRGKRSTQYDDGPRPSRVIVDPMPRPGPYDRDLDRNPANYTPLTPLSLIARTAYTYPNRLSVIHGDRRYTWAETYARSRRLASALVKAGIAKGDTVAVI